MASTAASLVEGPVTGPQKHKIRRRLKEFKTFIWNWEHSEFLGRTPMSWAKVCIFYLIFYGCLGAFFVAMIAVFYQTINWDRPRLHGDDSLLRNNPGLSFRPNTNGQTTLIRFIKGTPSTYKMYSDHIEAFLKFYENEGQVGENFMDCSNIKGFRDRTDWRRVCRFDLGNDLYTQGNPCVKQLWYGYDNGQPCVLLKLNKIYGWMPQQYSNDSVPDVLRGYPYYFENSINVRCFGESPADQENMGDLQYYPQEGFHFKYFPFLNQQGYRQPVMFIQFWNMTNGVTVMVTCKAYAQNIVHNTRELAGSVHFEMQTD